METRPTLKIVAPELLTEEMDIVIPLESEAGRAKGEYERAIEARKVFTGVFSGSKTEVRDKVHSFLDTLPSKLHKIHSSLSVKKLASESGAARFLPAGLAVMLIIGISEIFGIDLSSIEPGQYFLLLLAVASGVALTFAGKRVVYLWVKSRGEAILGQNRPIWENIKRGDALAITSALIVLGEAAFATPGLLSLLPPSLSSNLLYQGVIFLTAGLAAFVNISLAWGVALSELRSESKYRHLVENREQEVSMLEIDPVVIASLRRHYDREVAEIEERYRRIASLAFAARKDWSKKVNRVMNSRAVKRLKREEADARINALRLERKQAQATSNEIAARNGKR
jgi:hypothetical protein